MELNSRNTSCGGIKEAKEEIKKLRRDMITLAKENGLRLASAATHPFADWRTQEITSVGQANFEWIVDAVAELAVKKALSDENPARELRWAGFLKGGDVRTEAAQKPVPRRRRA